MADNRAENLPPIWKKPLDPAIHLRVYRNGDGHFPGKMVTLNKKQQRTFDSWLRDLSSSMKLRSGAVWRVFTPTQGHRVDDFEALEDGHMIVVAGQERFKPLRYAQIDPNPRRAAPKTYNVEPGHNKRYQVSGKFRKIETHAKIIKCWANGNDTTAPRTVLLPAYRNRPISLEAVIEQVSGVLCEECNGPVEKLYLPNGIKVMSLDQILPNAHYVALRKYDIFKRAHYKETSLPNLRTSPRLDRKFVLPPLPRSNKTSSHSSPEHSYASNNGSANSYKQRSGNRPYRRERVKREEDQVFHARPVKHKRSSEKIRQVDYDQDNGGVFKSKTQNHATRGARQIDDSRQTRTELPVDKRPAEQVRDEDEDQHSDQEDTLSGEDDQEEEVRGKNKRDKKGKKDEGAVLPPLQQDQRTYRANSKRPTSPGSEQNHREAEREARSRRETEDRERAEKMRRQKAAVQQKKDKENGRKKEEDRKRREEEEEEERRWQEEDEEERRRSPAGLTSTPDRYEDRNSQNDIDNSPRITPITDHRSGTEILRDEERHRERELAATKIQAGFRGYRTRKALKKEREESSGGRKSSFTRNETESPPAHEEEQWTSDARRDSDDRIIEEKAALKLQAGFRGYKARQELKQLRATQEVKNKGHKSLPHSAADPIPYPAVSSNHNSAHVLSLTDAEHAAATKIQAVFRGHHTRKQLSRAESEHAAAAKIQAVFRGHHTRKQLSRADAEHATATKIQALVQELHTHKMRNKTEAAYPEEVGSRRDIEQKYRTQLN